VSVRAGVLLTGLSGSLPATEPPTWSAGVSVDRVAWLASVAWFGSKAQGVWVRRALPHHLSADLNARVLSTPLLVDGKTFEVGSSLGYTPSHPWYHPRVALSAGWSGGVFFDWADYHGEGWQEQAPVARADYRPWYAGVQVEPLAFQLRPVEVSVFGGEVNQMGWGRVVRARVHLLRAGFAW
jgi:hypothetical protein